MTLELYIKPFRALRYPAIVFPLIHYTIAWTLGNILPAVTIASIWTKLYGMRPAMIGVSFGVATIIGSLIGEIGAGALSDHLVATSALKSQVSNAGISKEDLSTHTTSLTQPMRNPTLRLLPTIVSSLLLPAGLLIYGFTLSSADDASIYPPLVGLATAVCGLQISSTLCYAYISDTHPQFISEAASLFNLGRGLSFVIGFIALPLRDSIGYRGAWGVFAAIAWVGWWGVGGLIIADMSSRRRNQIRGGKVTNMSRTM